jgi:hypothetical protein
VLPQTFTSDNPGANLVRPGAVVTVPIRLHGGIPFPSVDVLSGRIRVTPAATVRAGRDPDELRAAGYSVATHFEGDDLAFEVRPRPGEEVKPLQDLPILAIDVTVPEGVGRRYDIAVYDLASQPRAAVCPGMNVLIVPMG